MHQPFETLPFVIREFGLASPAAPAAGHRPVVVTVVVDDLAVAGPALATQLGCRGRAVDPVELREAGLAQRFDLGGGCVLALEPGDDTAARGFLLAHGEGVYAVAFAPGDIDPVITSATPPRETTGSVAHPGATFAARRGMAGHLLHWAGALAQAARAW